MYIELKECSFATASTPRDKTFWWRLMSANHKVLATSETYYSRANRNRAVRSVVSNCWQWEWEDDDGKYVSIPVVGYPGCGYKGEIVKGGK